MSKMAETFTRKLNILKQNLAQFEKLMRENGDQHEENEELDQCIDQAHTSFEHLNSKLEDAIYFLSEKE